MKGLTQALVDTVLAAFSGKRREKLLKSIALINDSAAYDNWLPGASRSASGGFYQGISKARIDSDTERRLDNVGTAEWHCTNSVEFLIHFGRAPRLITKKEYDLDRKEVKGLPSDLRGQIALGIKMLREHGNLKLSDEVLYAWADLCAEVKVITEALNSARPKPVITKIGLSPKVTATLTEMNLDIDLASIRYPDIEWVKVKMLDRKGNEVEVEVPFIKWTKGIVHGASRFAKGGNCHACGKYIPSGKFVPIEAKDKKNNRLISMWLGCDCARNIFGVKDVGIDRSESKE